MSVRERLDAARLYLCTDARADRGDLLPFVRAALAGGVDVVQLRDRSLTTAAELALLEQVRGACDEAGALLAVNDRADLAAAVRADVLHVGQDDLPPAAGRALLGSDVVIGRSSRGGEQAAAAATDSDVDYFCVGPVWETPTKPGRPAVGLERIRETAIAGHVTPWFAIGGIDEQRLPHVLDAGATRIVVVRAITGSDDPERAARRLRRLLPR